LTGAQEPLHSATERPHCAAPFRFWTMNHAPPHILPVYILATMLVLQLSGCSFDPPSPHFEGADDGVTSPADMRPEQDFAGSGNNLPGADQGTPLDMPLPPQDMPSPQDMSEDMRMPPVDMNPPPQDMQPPADMTPPVEDMGPTSMPAICDGNRTDLAIDPNNCGECGARCDTSVGTCELGKCVCNGSGLEYCESSGACEDTQADPNHCGGCGNACQTGELCIGGVCDCTGDLERCDGECVDTSVDPRHCGMCGNSCGGDACRSGSCRSNDRCGGAPLEYVRCREHGGVACVRNENQTGVRYCRPGQGFDFDCGERCDGDELCIKPDTFEPYQCRPYRVGRGCTSCPCDDCGEGEWCRPAVMTQGKVWCVDPD